MHRLQEYLYTIPYIRREDILPITVYRTRRNGFQKQKRSKEANKAEAKKDSKNKEHVVSQKPPEEEPGLSETVSHQYNFSQLIFALGIIGMLVITWLSEDNVTTFKLWKIR